MKKKIKYTWIILSVILLITIVLSLGWGSYQIAFSDIWKILVGQGTKMQNIAVFTLRLPRIITAMLVATALSIAGALLQGITKNDLADAGIIGINAGASLAAVLFIFSQGSLYYQAMGNASIMILPIIALLGAFLSAGLIYFISSSRDIHPQRLLLTGIGVNIAINACIMFLTFQGSTQDYNRVLVWTSGSLWGSGWIYALSILPIVIIVTGLVMYHHKTLDILQLKDELAISLGVSVEKERKRFLCYAIILAGGATAVAGNISFLGLLGPHIAKSMVGTKHKHYLPVSILISMIIIVVADSVSRNLFSPIEIPAGNTISLIGVPYFIYLMLKEKSL